MRDQDVHMLTKQPRRHNRQQKKTKRCWEGVGGRELIKVKVTKGCKHARNTESPPVCVVKHTEGYDWACGDILAKFLMG